MAKKQPSGAARRSKKRAAAADNTNNEAGPANGMNGDHHESDSEDGEQSDEFSIPADAAFEFDVEKTMTPAEVAEKRKEEGSLLYRERAYKEAVDKYTASIEALPTYTPAIFNRSAAYMALKNYILAKTDVERCLILQGHPSQSKTLARLGKIQIALGEIETAHLTLLSAREACTDTPAVLNAIQADIAKIERIRQHLSSVERERVAESYGMMAFALEQAIKEVEVVPIPWRILKLQALIGKKAHDEATFYATDLVRSAPTNPEALYWRGQLLYRFGNFDQAKAHFEKSLSSDPDFSLVIPALKKMRQFDSKREAGKQAFSGKRWEEAVQIYTEALQIDEKNEHVQVLFRSNRAAAHNAMKNYDASLSDSEYIISLQPNHVKALRSKARAQLGLEQYEESVETFKLAFEATDAAGPERQSIKTEYESAKRELKRSKQKDYYKELGLNRKDDPSEYEIKRAYKKMSMLHHPDKGGTEEKFKIVAEAYSILNDPQKKARYDNGEDLEASGGGMPQGFEHMFGGGFPAGFGGFSSGGMHGGGSPFDHMFSQGGFR